MPSNLQSRDKGGGGKGVPDLGLGEREREDGGVAESEGKGGFGGRWERV